MAGEVVRKVARVLVENDDEKFLLARSSRSGSTKVIGGGIEPDETPEQAATRELAEEAGLVAVSLVSLGTVTEVLGNQNNNPSYGLKAGDRQEVTYFKTNDFTGTAQPGSDVSGLIWVDRGDVEKRLTYETQRSAVKKLLK